MSCCKVKGCRFSYHHITARHQCGTCDALGHGQLECSKGGACVVGGGGDDEVPLSETCRIDYCFDPKTHTTQGHSCLYCRKRENHLKECPFLIGFKHYETVILNDISLPVGKYIIKDGGMGCHNFYRKNKTTHALELFFMHSDSWGQYGENTSEVPQLNAFLDGYSTI